jgi:phage gpG-like protein
MAKSNVPRVKLYIDGDGLQETETQFAEIAARASDAKPIMRAIQALMVEDSIEQFASEGDSVGEGWEQDTPEWKERKSKEGLSDKTLIRHGKLRDAMMAKTGGAGAIRRLSKHSATVGVRLYYARFAGKKRRLLTMTVPKQDKYASMMIDYIIEGKVGER